MMLNPKFNIPSAREIFKSLKNAKREWKQKTPMQKWCYLYGIGKTTYGPLRIPFFNDVNHVHWFGYFIFVYYSITILLSIYTLCYYTWLGELEMGLPSTCMAFIFVGHIPMLATITFNQRFELQSLIDFGGRYIYHDSHEKTEYNRICSEHVDKTMKGFIIKMGAIFISYVCVMIGPMHAYFRHGIRTTIFEARVPFTEPKSNAEFIGNFVLQSVVGLHGIVCYFGLECFLTILENVVTITPRLIENDLVHTILLYEKNPIAELALNVKIRNIVKQSKDADNYVDSMSHLFYWRNLFTSAAFTYMIGMAIFCQYTMGFAAGYGLACMSWIQLFYVCELGENVQDNGFAEMLYHSKWEVLPPRIQKVIMLLIHRKQNEEGLSLGPFGMGINRETFKVSTNKVYTFVMFLKSLFK